MREFDHMNDEALLSILCLEYKMAVVSGDGTRFKKIEDAVLQRMGPRLVTMNSDQIEHLYDFVIDCEEDDPDTTRHYHIVSKSDGSVLVVDAEYPDEPVSLDSNYLQPPNPIQWTVSQLTDNSIDVTKIAKDLQKHVDNLIIRQIIDDNQYGLDVEDFFNEFVDQRRHELEGKLYARQKETATIDVRETGEICLLWHLCQNPKA